MRVVLDTNVLVSALVSKKGSPAQLLAMCYAGELELLVSPDILAELRRVLSYPRVRKRLHNTEKQIDGVVALLEQNATVIPNPPNVRVVPDDPDDDKFAAVALAGGAEYLVTGDEHVLKVGQHQGITLLKPGIFLALWRTLQQEEPEAPSEEAGDT